MSAERLDPGIFDAAESWSVSYDGDVYLDARKINGYWYFRSSLSDKFRYFDSQERVVPICKNPTRKKLVLPWRSSGTQG